jgi:putative ABC transport system permease protein
MIQPTGRFLAPVGGDRVALSTVAAGRLGARPGERIELPTLTGPAPFKVVGVFDPVAVDDSAVGDWVLTSATTARTAFGAVRSQMDIDVAARDRATVAAALRRTGTGLVVLDAAGWASVSHGTWARWFRPFAISGYLIAVAGGLAVMNILLLAILQRRRTRAAMRAIGQTAASERATLLTQAAVFGTLAIVFGLVWSQLFVWLLSLSSPVYYGFQLVWAVVPGQVALGAVMIVALVGLATIAPILAARRLDVAAALSAE